MKRLIIISAIFSFCFSQQTYLSEIQPIWDNNCTSSCHISSSLNGGLNLSSSTSYSELVNVASQGYSGFMRVKPGDAMNSVLHQKIVGNSSFGERMPKGGNTLSQADEEKIKKWIEDGALQNWSGASSDGITVKFKSADTFNGIVRVGYVPQGNDPNYWTNVTHKWGKHNFDFPGEYTATVWNTSITDGEAHLIVFVDSNNDDHWDNATEYGAISNVFQVTNKQGDAGTLTLMKGGGGGGTPNTIQIVVRLNQDIGMGDVHVGAWLPGNNADPDIVDSKDNRNTPSPTEGWGFELNDSRITPNSGPYRVEAFFDQNNNDIPDGTEPIIVINNINTDNQGYVYIDIDLSGGGGGPELYTDAVEIVFKSMAPHLAAVNLINTGNLWLAVYENENVKPIDALPDIPDNPIFKDRILDFDQNPVQNAIYTFKDENFQAIYDSGYAFVAWYNQDRYMGNDQTSNDFDIAYDPYSWGTFHVNRQSIEQGNKLKLEMHLHFIPGPEITPPSASSIQAIKGEELQLVFSASASQMTGSEVEQAQVEYRYGLESGIEWRIEMANDNGNGTWMATIPANHLTMGGLFVMYTAHDEMGVWSSSERYDIQVEFPDLAFEPHFKITTAETYEMISVPAVLQNYSSDAVLADELGGYDKKKWRLFKWSNGQYVESNVSFTPGAAYWLITKNGEQINTGPGKSTRIYSSSKISLFDGWNMVGNPYIFPINLVEHVGLSENVEPTLYEWNGSSYNNTTHMMPKGGNWVYSNGNGTMEFFPIWKPGLFSEVEVIPEETADEEDFNWKAKIITKAGNRYDETATFGVHESASDTWDRFDYHEPPVIGNYISMAFDNDSWAKNGGSYSQDIRSDFRTQTWNLAARSNIKGIVSLRIEDVHAIPSHQDVRLVDPVLGIVYNLRSEKAVTFTSQGNENPYYFKLIVGEADDIQLQLDDMGMVPTDFELFQNTPNPFNPVTNIRVSLIESANITLKVYSLLGEELNAIAVNKSFGKGNFRFIWDGKHDNGRQLPSGIYLYSLEVRSQSGVHLYQDTKKMVLMK